MKIKGKYSLEEIMPITEVARGLNRVVAKIREKSLGRAVIVRNNKPEVIMIDVREYEELKRKEQTLELIEINSIVRRRGKVAKPNTMSMKEMFDKSRSNRKNEKV